MKARERIDKDHGLVEAHGTLFGLTTGLLYRLTTGLRLTLSQAWRGLGMLTIEQKAINENAGLNRSSASFLDIITARCGRW